MRVTYLHACSSALAFVRRRHQSIVMFTEGFNPLKLLVRTRDGAEFLILLHVNKYWTCCGTCMIN